MRTIDVVMLRGFYQGQDTGKLVSPRGRRVAQGFDGLSGDHVPGLTKAFPLAGAVFSFPVLSRCSFIS